MAADGWLHRITVAMDRIEPASGRLVRRQQEMLGNGTQGETWQVRERTYRKHNRNEIEDEEGRVCRKGTFADIQSSLACQ